MQELTIAQNDSGQRLDKFLSKALPALPKSLMYRAIRQKRIKRNGKRCAPDDRLCCGDRLQLYLNDDVFVKSHKTRPAAFSKAAALGVPLFESEHLLLAEKPAGIDAHPSAGNQQDSMLQRIQRYLAESGAYHPEQEQSFAPALCNRLDRNTTGILLAAKTAEGLRDTNALIRAGEIRKQYLCITTAPPPKQTDIAEAYHKKLEDNRVVIRDAPAEGFRQIRTGYRICGEHQGLWLVEVTLLTGRTHQIRAHFAHLGAPLLGDPKYGDRKQSQQRAATQQALCAYAVEFCDTKNTCLASLAGKRFSIQPKFPPSVHALAAPLLQTLPHKR